MNRKHLFLSLFFLPIIITGFFLAQWQYQRSLWKQDLLSAYTKRLNQSPQPLPILSLRLKGDKASISGKNEDLFKQLDLLPVMVTGEFDTDIVFFKPTSQGLNIITAFKTSDGVIPIDVGRISLQPHDIDLKKILPTSPTTLKGFYRIPTQYAGKLPYNKQLVSQVPYPLFLEKYKTNLLVGSFQVRDDSVINNFLKGQNAQTFIKNIPNNHIQYMFTWIFLSLIAGVIYIILFRNTPNKS